MFIPQIKSFYTTRTLLNPILGDLASCVFHAGETELKRSFVNVLICLIFETHGDNHHYFDFILGEN